MTCPPDLETVELQKLAEMLAQVRAKTQKRVQKRMKASTGALERPVSCWSERELLDGEEVRAFVMIFRTQGCKWSWGGSGGCSMCGYCNDSAGREVTDGQLRAQLASALGRYKGEPVVKIFCSGSFLDTDEVPVSVQDAVLEQFGAHANAKQVTIESRPEFVTAERVRALVEAGQKAGGSYRLEVALGLESASDMVLERSINKGFTVGDYQRAAETARAAGALVKTYVLLKPPFLTEAQAIADAATTIAKAAAYSDTISLNPVNIQRGTLVERLWQNSEYRAPWLWSVVEVLKRSKTSVPANVRVISAPSGAGTLRGAHNCLKCDTLVIRAIEAFTLGYGATVFDKVACECACREQWRDTLELEGPALCAGWAANAR